MRKYVIMGVQGSGKGTQSQMLASDLDLVHISVGDIFRWNVQNHTKIGAMVRRTMAAGELVGDDRWNRWSGTGSPGTTGTTASSSTIPRNRPQAEFFLESYDIDGVSCSTCGFRSPRACSTQVVCQLGINYNYDSSPKVPGRCDSCGGELVTREDDTEEALAVRLRDYHEKTNPVLDLFRRKEYVFTVDARPAPEVVQEQIRKCLGLPAYQGEEEHAARPGSAGA